MWTVASSFWTPRTLIPILKHLLIDLQLENFVFCENELNAPQFSMKFGRLFRNDISDKSVDHKEKAFAVSIWVDKAHFDMNRNKLNFFFKFHWNPTTEKFVSFTI